MAKRAINNIKLGVFTIGGLLFLVLLLYMIGKNQHLFGDTYILKARFENIQGLIGGNNVRYAGIETGTVKEINIINDTTIEITMVIDKKMNSIIRKNAIVSVGTEGFVGNKVVNIIPARQPAGLAMEGDVLFSKRAVNTEEMLETLSSTNNDIAVITSELKSTVQRINNSHILWDLLNDKSIPLDMKRSLANIRLATSTANDMTRDLLNIVADIKMGKGSAGILLKDTAFATNLNGAVLKIKSAGEQADSLVAEINKTVEGITGDIENGKGMLHTLLKDSAITEKVNAALNNIQQGTDGFNQNMEALKHNFLFRGYFRKLERQKQKEEKAKNVSQ